MVKQEFSNQGEGIRIIFQKLYTCSTADEMRDVADKALSASK